MLKGLSILALAVSVLLFLVFGLDLAVGVPLGGANMMMNISFIVVSAVLGYLSWTALRECG